MTSPMLHEEELSRLNRQFEQLSAQAVMAWACERFGRELVVASSFQDSVLVNLATKADPAVEVVFLDTGAHFPETLAFLDAMRERYRLRVSVLRPADGAEAWPCGSPACCEFRKVKPLQQFLRGRTAWVTGLRRVESPSRAGAAILVVDHKFGVIKINPLATWSDVEVESYAHQNNIPIHPLAHMGYASIGCAPTTAPVSRGADTRSGRWPGQEKTECGLHI